MPTEVFGTWLCNGLIQDWASWQKEKGQAFEALRSVLKVVSPSPKEPLVPGELTRISLDDVRDMPTIRMPYGKDVAVLHASAGMRRIIAPTMAKKDCASIVGGSRQADGPGQGAGDCYYAFAIDYGVA